MERSHRLSLASASILAKTNVKSPSNCKEMEHTILFDAQEGGKDQVGASTRSFYIYLIRTLNCVTFI